MANAATRQVIFRRPGETVYGSLIIGAITNGDFDVALEPGFYRMQLLVNANTVSAGTITASPLDGAGAALSEEPLIFLPTAGSPVVSGSLIDLVGALHILPSTNTSAANQPIGIYSGIRFTIASIAGAGATNRIDYIFTRTA